MTMLHEAKVSKHDVDGIVLLNKPQGLSSNAALQQVKRLFAAKKAGHTGTLDPMATGMLPICLGEATKYSQYLLNQSKTYEVTATLGTQTDTGDALGEVIRQCPLPSLSEDALKRMLSRFLGQTMQVPPMYSALKHQGKPLYQYARAGVEIPREARAIEITDLVLTDWTKTSFRFTTTVSKGTYIRTLVEAMGEALGTCAHMSQLHRTTAAGFKASEMKTLDELREWTPQARQRFLLPVARAVSELPVLQVTAAQEAALYEGKKLVLALNRPPQPLVALFGEGNVFFGVGTECIEPLTSSPLTSEEAGTYLKAKRLLRRVI